MVKQFVTVGIDFEQEIPHVLEKFNQFLLLELQKEKEILQEALQSREAEMVAVIGRRRVGKTFLINMVCGSAASWMIQNLVNNTGGLYNRITRRVFVYPFTLAETKKYFQARLFNFTNYEIVEIYMAMGGIPHYLKEVKGHKSATQNVDDICFSRSSLLRDEFRLMFSSLFENAEKHIAIIRALSISKQGLTRQKIIELGKIPENGNTSKVLEELEQSSFITSYYPFGKVKKDMLYRLTDEYSLFYLQFIENKVHEGSGTWQHLSQTQEYKTWSGYAFETICLKHVPQIKKAMSIGGVYSLSSTFYQKATDERRGAQIDLLLDRADNIINVFEIKFNNGEITLIKEQSETLRRKLWTFAEVTKTKKRLSLVLVGGAGYRSAGHNL